MGRKEGATVMVYRCPKGSRPIMDLETCSARKKRKHYGCVTCRVPGQKRREAKAAAMNQKEDKNS